MVVSLRTTDSAEDLARATADDAADGRPLACDDADRGESGDDDGTPSAPLREVPIDWEALEDAFENNAPEVHSYLHLTTAEVLRIVDGVADPQMHARIAADPAYLRVDPVSSREQYRWMERYIPMIEEPELRGKLAASIDGKGAFRRFKDVLMAHGPERERWFTFRSERLRIFMEAWLEAHALAAVARPLFAPELPTVPTSRPSDPTSGDGRDGRRARSAEAARKLVRDAAEALTARDVETLAAFAEFLRARRAARQFAHHAEAREYAAHDEAGEAPREPRSTPTPDADPDAEHA